ncbi:MAG TPA: FecR domain-containing protein [Polyangiaceae bacterium]
MKLDDAENERELRVTESVAHAILSGVARSRSTALDRSFSVVEARFARHGRRMRRLRAALLIVGTVGAGLALWGRAHLANHTGEQITYESGPGLGFRRGELVAPSTNSGPADVRFSDGTLVRMEPGARGRVVRLDGEGATVAVYEGTAHVSVRHRANARWLFDAGPFEVLVHGTAFAISWDALSSRFDLQMESGVVSVTGPLSGGEIRLRAGQKLSITLADHEDGGAPAAAVVTGSHVADLSAALPAPSALPDPMSAWPPDAVPQRPDRTPAANGWRAQLEEGRAAAIVAEAKRQGLGQVLDAADSEDLAALADAARYIGNDDVARRAFHAQRRRFPGSKRAAEASFLLGRLEDQSPAGAARALAWYDRYLMEAPSGAYASEALGRKMMVLERSGQHEDALAIARAYLRRFASGSYAHAASALVGPSEPQPGSRRRP